MYFIWSTTRYQIKCSPRSEERTWHENRHLFFHWSNYLTLNQFQAHYFELFEYKLNKKDGENLRIGNFDGHNNLQVKKTSKFQKLCNINAFINQGPVSIKRHSFWARNESKTAWKLFFKDRSRNQSRREISEFKESWFQYTILHESEAISETSPKSYRDSYASSLKAQKTVFGHNRQSTPDMKRCTFVYSLHFTRN